MRLDKALRKRGYEPQVTQTVFYENGQFYTREVVWKKRKKK